MNNFYEALHTETLKLFRSKVPLFTALGFSMAPLMGGLFMIILKNPEAAKSLGLITTKAQLLTGTAEWSSFFNFMAQAVAAGGMVLFSIVTIWVFGREFSDHTVKELLALPTSREAIITAKFIVIGAWSLVITLLILGISLVVGKLVVIPGWSTELFQTSFTGIIGTALLTLPLISFVALLASTGRGYMPPFAWVFLTLILANLSAILGWGDWFPWAVPLVASKNFVSHTNDLGLHGYLVIFITCVLGVAGTLLWWRRADQTR